jgi:hypothetical protein
VSCYIPASLTKAIIMSWSSCSTFCHRHNIERLQSIASKDNLSRVYEKIRAMPVLLIGHLFPDPKSKVYKHFLHPSFPLLTWQWNM